MTIKVNLLPTERKRVTFDPLLAFLVVVVILCTVGFVLYGSMLQGEIESKEAEIAKREGEIKQIEQSLPVIDDLKSQIAKLEDEIRVIEGLVYDPVRYGNLLTEVGRVLPTNVYVNSLTVEPSTTSVMLSGVAKNTRGGKPLASIASLMSRMSESSMLKDASLASTQMSGNEEEGFGFTFSIEARYDPDAAAGIAEKPKAAEAKAEDAVEQ